VQPSSINTISQHMDMRLEFVDANAALCTTTPVGIKGIK